MAWYDDPNAELPNMDSIFGPSVLSGGSWGTPSSDILFPTPDPNAAEFPWLSNGDSVMFGGTTPTSDWLGGLPDINFGGGGPGISPLGGGLWDFLTKGNMMGSISPSSILGTGARTAPGLAALAYAGRQPGIDVGPLQGILGQLGGNRDAVVHAATDPLQQNIAAGYGDLLQSQALRGIRGSSFGDADIGNYISTTGRALSNAGANAAQGSLSLQGNLAGNIAQLKNQAQLIKNSLYGRAFDVLGRGLNPGGYAGTTNINVPTGGGGVARSGGSDLDEIGKLVGIGGTIASFFSDRRLKTNVVKVADDPRGFGIYEYELFGKRERGVMADEIEEVMPEAVTTLIGGLKVVDYGRLYG